MDRPWTLLTDQGLLKRALVLLSHSVFYTVFHRPAVLLQRLLWKDCVQTGGKSKQVDEGGQQSEGKVHPHPQRKK